MIPIQNQVYKTSLGNKARYYEPQKATKGHKKATKRQQKVKTYAKDEKSKLKSIIARQEMEKKRKNREENRIEDTTNQRKRYKI